MGYKCKLETCFLAIEKFKNLEELVVLNTQETNYLDSAIKNSDDYSEFTFRKLIERYFDNKIAVTETTLKKPNEIQPTVEDLNVLLRYTLKKYTNEKIVFSITSGTAAVSAALAMVAIKGEREIVYLNQQSNVTISNTVDVFSIKELWEEILDKYE